MAKFTDCPSNPLHQRYHRQTFHHLVGHQVDGRKAEIGWNLMALMADDDDGCDAYGIDESKIHHNIIVGTYRIE